MTGLQSFRAMGCDVVVAGAGPRALLAIEELFQRRERTFSRFRPGSELSAVNGLAGRVVRVSEDFARLVETALRAAAATDGLVDPTLGRALAAAGYDRDFAGVRDRDEAPSPAGPGRWREVRLSCRFLAVPAGVVLDLNGVVKSATVDEAAALLDGDGFVSAGGDVAVRGPQPVGLPGGGAVLVGSGGIATSGTTRRRWRRAGALQHHLIDPGTGRPSGSPWQQVTVVAASCLEADVAAKAAFLLGETGPAWLDERDLAGRFLAAGRTLESEAWASATAREETAPCT